MPEITPFEKVLLSREERTYIDITVAQAVQQIEQGYALFEIVQYLRVKYSREFPMIDYRQHAKPQCHIRRRYGVQISN